MKIPNKVYDVLKWIALIVLPACATLYAAIAKIWGIPYELEIPATIMAVDTFIGALIGVSTYSYNKEKNEEE